MKALISSLVLVVAAGLSSVAPATPGGRQCSVRRPVAAPAGVCGGRKALTLAMDDGDECVQGCEDELNRCLDACGDDSFCQHRCELDQHRCMSGCNCPRSYETEDSQPDGSTYLGDTCGYEFSNPAPTWYGVYDITIKHQRKRVTRNCDGSTSEEVLEVWYTTSRCFQRGFSSCSPWDAQDLSAVCLI
jgi:hypothetical protein